MFIRSSIPEHDEIQRLFTKVPECQGLEYGFLVSFLYYFNLWIVTVLVKDLTENTLQQIQMGAQKIGNIFNSVASNYKSLKPASLVEGLNQVVEVSKDLFLCS